MTWLLFSLGFHFYTKNPKWKARLKWAAIFIFLFFSNSVVFSKFCGFWEIPGTRLEQVKAHDVAIVLGGMAEYNSDINALSIRRQGDRLIHAITLYKKGLVKKLLISGDSGFITDRGLHEAKQMKELLITWGIPETDIITEEKSVNTHENAELTVKLLRQKYPELKRVILVTSGIHMRRSLACFEKEGLKCSAYSTDLYSSQSGNYYWDQYFIPNFSVMLDWSKLMKEVTGYIAYDIVGYI